MQAAFAFCGADETRGKTSACSFCDCLRHGRRVACNVDMTAAQRHAHRPDTLSAIQKAACTLFRVGGAGCFFKFAANLSPLPRERVRVRAFSDGANFNFCMAAGLPSPQPSPTGEGVGLRLPSEGGLHLNITAKCRLPLPRAATLSVGMAAQRHAACSDSEIYSGLKLQ